MERNFNIMYTGRVPSEAHLEKKPDSYIIFFH